MSDEVVSILEKMEPKRLCFGGKYRWGELVFSQWTILICKIKYPNDPSGKIAPHQHFVGRYKEGILELYSISSIAGKEYKVYDKGYALIQHII